MHANGKKKMDVISQTLFGFSFIKLSSPDDEMTPLLRMLADFIGDTRLIKQFPFLKTISKRLPRLFEKAGLEGFLWFKRVRCSTWHKRQLAMNLT